MLITGKGYLNSKVLKTANGGFYEPSLAGGFCQLRGIFSLVYSLQL
jgi:hypothetical protein